MRKIQFAANGLVICAIIFVISVFSMIGCAKEQPADFSWDAQTGGNANVIPASAAVIPSTPMIFRNSGVVEIREKMFISQVNDIYLNAEDYLGRTIKLEGIFIAEQYYEDEAPYCFVIRYGPGCCGNDGNVGFEVRWALDKETPYPEMDAWVEAVGELKYYEENGYTEYLYLDLASLVVMDKRGVEFVRQ